MPTKTLKDVTVADAYLAVLADRGVDYLFANAGTDFAPLVEALAKAQALGTPHPHPVTCPHENTAQHMAIGYYPRDGPPAADDDACQCWYGERDEWFAQRIAGPDSDAVYGGPDPNQRRQAQRPSFARYPLDPGNVRPGRHDARGR